MCGIFGFITTKPGEDKFKTLVRLSMESASRGKDATGIAWFGKSEGGKKIGWWIKKHHVEAKEFYRSEMRKYRRAISGSTLCNGHTRTWTTGRPENNQNNHPIFSKSYVLVHNGACVSTPKVDDYGYRGDVDSELILAQIEDKGIREGLENSIGTAALAFARFDMHGRELLLYRTGNPIVLAYDPEGQVIYFASTDDIMNESLDGDSELLGFFSGHRLKDLPYRELWKIDMTDKGELRMLKVEDIDFGKHQWKRNWNTHQGLGAATQRNYGSSAGCNTGRGSQRTGGFVADRYEWHKYWHIGLYKPISVGEFSWTWHTDSSTWSHNKLRMIRRYNPYERRMEIATPTQAIKAGWMTESPYDGEALSDDDEGIGNAKE